MLSIKSGSNIIRYNTILDSPGAQLTLRHGNENQVYGNYMRGTDGIRIFGDRNHVFSNYLERNTGGINIGNGDGEVSEGAELTSHDRPDGSVITFNTLVNNDRQYYMTARTNGLGATKTVFANNIIVGGASAVSLAGPYSDDTWGGNVLWQTGTAAGVPAGAYDTMNPMLVPDASGIMRPQSNSPVVDAATGDYAMVVLDMDGQPRVGRKDRGADEISTAPATAKLLTVDEILRIIRDP
jgi:poly(beta-D-mannuronate) lyase